jgi:hypothetical protein
LVGRGKEARKPSIDSIFWTKVGDVVCIDDARIDASVVENL